MPRRQKYITADGQYSEGNCIYGLLSAITFEIWLQFQNFLKQQHINTKHEKKPCSNIHMQDK
jgi:hypothetical protein